MHYTYTRRTMSRRRLTPIDKRLVPLSKFLSRTLRHHPEANGLSLDAGGWADADQLLVQARRHGVALTRELLQEVVAQNDKRRFAFNEDGTRIRASQGHSIPIDLGLEPTQPPELLYHGTAARFISSIKTHGLRPGRRIHVHLSADRTTAARVGGRHGSPVVIEVRAELMHAAGYPFYLSANGVWLTKHVPVEYLSFPPEQERTHGDSTTIPA
jgi:putative RNA 2'-phosphotransferase